MRILLINPAYRTLSNKIKGSEWITPPLGLAYLASAVKEHEVKIVDMEQEKREIGEVIKEFNPDIVGLTATTPTVNVAFSVLEKAKSINQNIVTVIGGCHVSVLPYEAIKKEGVDIVIRGEGELTIKEIVDNLSGGKSVKGIKGTVQKEGSKVVYNQDRPPVRDLDSLPFPARELLDYETYRRPFAKGKKPVTILTSRGCPYGCIYCNKSVFGNSFRPRSAENVLDEIEELAKQGHDDFHILDDTFSIAKERAKKICQGIIDRGLKINWNVSNGMRIDRLDEELANLMKRSSCYCIGFGIESGNQGTHDYIQKNLKIEDIERGFKIAKRTGIDTIAFVIIGLPNETKEDIENTVKFLKRVMPAAVNFHILIPLPGTKVYNELKSNGYLLESDWSKYSFHNPPVYRTEHLTREDIIEEYRKAYKKYHFSARYMLSRLWRMRNLSQLKTNLRGLVTILRI
ncbi:B12-binding domain-containing radical SAM protein [Candidatus Woesearchaeota archaeon]|nr:B12-binding domain-containing radical SAM protein [Candidatus Woesearchaeota archaeon]|tara:strand:- start:3947 stop:5320 length:1374 start_codon:yes stop_codon:yes gene_type:complete